MIPTSSIESLIKSSPFALAILDRELRIVEHSTIFKQQFAPKTDSLIGKPYYELLPTIPEEIRQINQDCLKGASSSHDGKKFVAPNGETQWWAWKISPWTNADDAILGIQIIIQDVTETKRREALLVKAEQVARIGGWEVDLNTNEVYWTEVTKEIHEVAPDYVPNLEAGINFYKAGHFRNEITRLVSDAISQGTFWDTELIIVTAKGKELWVRAKGEAELVDGKCVRIYGTFQDIDEQKRISLDYKAVTERLTAATLGADFGIFNYYTAKDILEWDDGMFKVFGAEKSDFNGKYEFWRNCVHPEDIVRVEEEVGQAIATNKNFDSEFRCVWPNGELRHIRGIIVFQRDEEGNVFKMTGTNWDITELKTAKIQLHKSEESFHGAFENSNIGMAMVDLDGRWLRVNRSICQSLGYSESEIMALNFREVTHPEDLDKDVNLLNQIIAGERQNYQMEKRYLHKDGRTVYAILSVTAVRNIDGELSHFISQVMDITERTNAQKSLNKLVDVTKAQNESLLNFAHIVSHNLRSHSSNLSMLSGFLKTETDENERQNLLGMFSDAAQSLNETVVHLNEVVQVKAGAHGKMRQVNLYKTIKNVEKNLLAILKEKKAVCNIDIPEDLKIKAIPAYLDSIFLNLFTNSLKYSSPERTPVLSLKARRQGTTLVFSFSDNGLGIDLERHREKLFGMYKTFHRHKDAKGIGLFITKNQVEAMNGKIEVSSTVDVGTTFKLSFETN